MKILASLTALKPGWTLFLVLALSSTPFAGQAQTEGASQAELWRRANEAVGQFTRGHADLVKWEAAQARDAVAEAAAPHALLLASPQEAVQLAWKAHPGLRPTLNLLGDAALESILSGNWSRLDARLMGRLHGLDEILALAARARKDFVQLQAAQGNAAIATEVLHASRVGRELADRMLSVGNWSRLQQAPFQQLHITAELNANRSRLALVQAQNRLLQSLGLSGMHTAVRTSVQWSDLPENTGIAQSLDQHCEPAPAQWYCQNRLVPRSRLVQAHAVYQTTFENARLAQAAHQLQQLVQEETVLHYNGMLKSTWDVLAAARNRLLAAAFAVNARRDFEIAQIDWQWALLGGEPAGWAGLAEPETGPVAAGH